jgi:hypothetical protein
VPRPAKAGTPTRTRLATSRSAQAAGAAPRRIRRTTGRLRPDFAFGFVEVAPKRRKLRDGAKAEMPSIEAGILSTNSDQGQARAPTSLFEPPQVFAVDRPIHAGQPEHTPLIRFRFRRPIPDRILGS